MFVIVVSFQYLRQHLQHPLESAIVNWVAAAQQRHSGHWSGLVWHATVAATLMNDILQLLLLLIRSFDVLRQLLLFPLLLSQQCVRLWQPTNGGNDHMTLVRRMNCYLSLCKTRPCSLQACKKNKIKLTTYSDSLVFLSGSSFFDTQLGV